MGVRSFDKFASLKAFLHAAHSRSFKQAAQQLGQTPSGISKAIVRLEESLGVRLLHRTTRVVSLTDDGRAYLEYCERILGELEEAEAALTRVQAEPSGMLRVELPWALGGIKIVPALAAFKERFPNLQLQVLLRDQISDIVAEGIDATVRIGQTTDTGLVSRRLGEIRMITCAAPAYLESQDAPLSPADLSDHQRIQFLSLRTGRPVSWQFDGVDDATLPMEAGCIYLSSGQAMTEVAANGGGITHVHDYIVEPYLKDGRLVQILEDYTAIGTDIRVMYPHRKHLAAKVRVFVDFLTVLFEVPV